MSDIISGYWVALPTPLTGTGDLNIPALTHHTRMLFDQHGIDGVVPFGTTGEGTSFTLSERLSAIEALLKAGVAPSQIGLGAGFAAIGHSIELSRNALRLGLNHVLVLPPFFYRDATPPGIEDAFAAILDGVGDDRLRLTLYHIPQVSGVAIPPEVAASLRAKYGKLVAGIKDSSADFSHFRAFRAAAPELAILVGNEADIARARAEGGTGTICGLANVVPEQVRAVFEGPAGETAMKQTISYFANRPFVPTLKAIMAAQSGDSGWLHVRPPLRSLPLADGERIAAALRGEKRPAAA